MEYLAIQVKMNKCPNMEMQSSAPLPKPLNEPLPFFLCMFVSSFLVKCGRSLKFKRFLVTPKQGNRNNGHIVDFRLGLAFSPLTGSCEWPDTLIETGCNPEGK